MFEGNFTELSLGLLGLLIVISPGADFVLVLKNSVTQGRRAGIWTAIGISLAISVHIGYSLMGIRYLVSHNEWLYHLIQYAGAVYLIYLGLKGIFFANQETPDIDNSPGVASRHFWQGFLCNALNPKTMLFFISIFSQVVAPEGKSNMGAYLYGGYMVLLHAVWFILVAFALTSTRLQKHLNRIKTRLNQLCGMGLLAFGVTLAFRT